MTRTAGQLSRLRQGWLLPAATKRFVKLHDAQKLTETTVRKRQFGLIEIAVGVERIQLRVHSSAIPNVGEPRAILERRHQLFLFDSTLAGSLMRDQRV